MIIGVYFTHPTTGTVHIVDFDQDAIYFASGSRPSTFCGAATDAPWTPGDETAGGIAATCRRCKSLFRRAAAS